VTDVGRGTTDQQAYDLYLKGRYYWMARGADNVRRSIDYFKQALARDSNFARAQAGLALAYLVQPVWVPDPTDSVSPLLAGSARRALRLDSTLADAQLAYASTLENEMRFADAEIHYRKAIELEPSNEYAHHVLPLPRRDARDRDRTMPAREAVAARSPKSNIES
jgi:serine/threonine-protein kinase